MSVTNDVRLTGIIEKIMPDQYRTRGPFVALRIRVRMLNEGLDDQWVLVVCHDALAAPALTLRVGGVIRIRGYLRTQVRSVGSDTSEPVHPHVVATHVYDRDRACWLTTIPADSASA